MQIWTDKYIFREPKFVNTSFGEIFVNIKHTWVFQLSLSWCIWFSADLNKTKMTKICVVTPAFPARCQHQSLPAWHRHFRAGQVSFLDVSAWYTTRVKSCCHNFVKKIWQNTPLELELLVHLKNGHLEAWRYLVGNHPFQVPCEILGV